MKLTLIRTDRETGKESFSTLEAENLIAKIKKENKAAHVSALRQCRCISGTKARSAECSLDNGTCL